MSHIVTIKTEVRDPAAVASACRRLELTEPVQGAAELFSGSTTGLIVKLPGWVYPAVINTDTGEVRYDNYNGAWGDDQQLHRFLQAYAVERTRIEARRKGYHTTEQTMADGSIMVEIEVGGSA